MELDRDGGLWRSKSMPVGKLWSRGRGEAAAVERGGEQPADEIGNS